MRAARAVLLACLAVLAVQSRANIVTTAQGQPDLSTLVAAVQAAGLVEALSNPTTPLTVFAPTNAAFAELIAALGTTAEDLLANKDLLTDVLTYHVVPAAATAASLTDGQILPTLLSNQTLTVNIAGTPPTVSIMPMGGEAATVIMPDVMAMDSVGSIVHVINKVLLPEM